MFINIRLFHLKQRAKCLWISLTTYLLRLHKYPFIQALREDRKKIIAQHEVTTNICCYKLSTWCDKTFEYEWREKDRSSLRHLSAWLRNNLLTDPNYTTKMKMELADEICFNINLWLFGRIDEIEENLLNLYEPGTLAYEQIVIHFEWAKKELIPDVFAHLDSYLVLLGKFLPKDSSVTANKK